MPLRIGEELPQWALSTPHAKHAGFERGLKVTFGACLDN
jgi:hypothetical protein